MALSILLVLAVFITKGDAEVPPPAQGFHLISNTPERGKNSDAFYLYALSTSPLGEEDRVEFEKDGGLPSEIVQTGDIMAGTDRHGCYLKVHAPNQMKSVRYGRYKANLIPPDIEPLTAYSFIKPRTDKLDTQGVYTATIYPLEVGSTKLHADSVTDIGVAWRPGCLKMVWCKGTARIKNTGPRLKLSCPEDAGLYTIRRKRRGTFVQILVTAADCPPDMYWDDVDDMCKTRTVNCMNSGVGRNNADSCICPPFFIVDDCSFIVPPSAESPYVLAFSGPEDITCGGLPGGNEKCKGFLFCYLDLYGCSCAPGWYGNNCDRPCQKGRWGVNCKNACPDGSDCNRFFGMEPEELF